MLGRDGDDPVAALGGAFSTVPLSAQLSASVALPVKATLPPSSPIACSTCSRATLDRRRGLASPARRRMRVGELSSIHGRIASATSGATGVVA